MHVYPLLLMVIRKHILYCAAWPLYKILHWITVSYEYQFSPGVFIYRSHTSFLVPMHTYFRCCTYRLHELKLPKWVEEGEMQKNAQHDLKILAVADALQADDRLLGTTIKSALEQSDANWVQLVEFAVQIVGNHIPVVDSETSFGHILNAYRSLLPSVREAIDEILQSHVKSKAVKASDDSIMLPSNWNTLARWTFCILAQGDISVVAQDIGVLKEFHLAQMLYQAAGFGYKLDILNQVTDSSLLWRVILCLLQHHKGSDDVEKKLLMHGLKLDFSILCSVLQAVYTETNDIHQLANMIHSIADYNSSNFQSLKAIEILKLSLLSVRAMSGKIHVNRDNGSRWSSVEATQWKRTFIWLAHRLWDFWPFSNLSPDELAALHQLARSGWKEIPDPIE
ncbi:hypothetical protein BC629DRAFT_1701585, partial [Irpex lacteus]